MKSSFFAEFSIAAGEGSTVADGGEARGQDVAGRVTPPVKPKRSAPLKRLLYLGEISAARNVSCSQQCKENDCKAKSNVDPAGQICEVWDNQGEWP